MSKIDLGRFIGIPGKHGSARRASLAELNSADTATPLAFDGYTSQSGDGQPLSAVGEISANGDKWDEGTRPQ